MSRLQHKLFVTILALMLTGFAALRASAQSAQKSTRTSASRTDGADRSIASTKATLDLLTRLRAMRDCWADPYVVVYGDYPKDEEDGAFFQCGSQYALRLAEARAAATDAVEEINNPAIVREANAAIGVLNDLDTLFRIFEGRSYFILTKVRVSDVYSIIHKYNISYKEDWTLKAAIYRQMMPHRRIHIDRLATMIPNAPPDPNPTLTAAQAEAVTDDLTWARATRDMMYDWYLGRYPNGRHAAEARDSLGRKSQIRKERDDQLEMVRRDLENTTHKVLEAYVRGDKATYGNFLSSRFPSREIYIAKLKPQPEVVSFEIKDFEVKPYDSEQQSYRATMNVRYVSIFNKERDYRNSILYLKADHGWQIVEWH